MRRLHVALFGLLAGCARAAPVASRAPCSAAPSAAAAATASASTASAASAASAKVPFASCPNRLVEAPPAVLAYADLAEAAKKLKSPLPDHPVDLQAAVKERGSWLFIDVPLGYFHESSTVRIGVAAVFVGAPKVVVMPRLIDVAHPLPSTCGNGRGSEAVAIAVLERKGAAHARVGHVRVVRAGVFDEPTLGSQPYTGADPRCAQASTYRIEDHFVDLQSGEHLAAVAQTFVGAVYGPAAPLEGVAFDAFEIGEDGVGAGEREWFWNE